MLINSLTRQILSCAIVIIVATIHSFSLSASFRRTISQDCRIGVETQNQFTVYAVQQNRLQPIFDVDLDDFSGLQNFSISPNQQYLATERVNLSNSSEKEIAIYDISGFEPVKVAVIPDEQIIRGNHWSLDSTMLLTQDAYLNQLLSMYDIPTQQSTFLAQHFDPILKVYQVTWGSNNTIGFVAFDRIMRTTQYGINRVSAMYVMDLDTFDNYPISKPTEWVDWYFRDSFVLSESGIASYTASDMDTNKSGLNVVSIDKTKTLFREGNYQIIDGIWDKRILLL